MITQKCGRILMKFYGLTDCMTEIKFLTFGNDLGYNPSTNSEDHGSWVDFVLPAKYLTGWQCWRWISFDKVLWMDSLRNKLYQLTVRSAARRIPDTGVGALAQRVGCWVPSVVSVSRASYSADSKLSVHWGCVVARSPYKCWSRLATLPPVKVRLWCLHVAWLHACRYPPCRGISSALLAR